MVVARSKSADTNRSSRFFFFFFISTIISHFSRAANASELSCPLFCLNAKNEFHFIGRKETGHRSLFNRDGLSFGALYTWRMTAHEIMQKDLMPGYSVPFVIDLCVLRVRPLRSYTVIFSYFPLAIGNVMSPIFLSSFTLHVEKYFEIYFLSSKQRDRWAVPAKVYYLSNACIYRISIFITLNCQYFFEKGSALFLPLKILLFKPIVYV